MKTTITLNNKKISKKKAIELFGKESIERKIKEAKEAFINDPYELSSWYMGSKGMLSIEFN